MLATEYGSKKLDLYCIYVYTLSLLQSNEEKPNDYACWKKVYDYGAMTFVIFIFLQDAFQNNTTYEYDCWKYQSMNVAKYCCR